MKNKDSIRKLLQDLHGYIGSGYENKKSDNNYKDRISAALAQLDEETENRTEEYCG